MAFKDAPLGMGEQSGVGVVDDWRLPEVAQEDAAACDSYGTAAEVRGNESGAEATIEMEFPEDTPPAERPIPPVEEERRLPEGVLKSTVQLEAPMPTTDSGDDDNRPPAVNETAQSDPYERGKAALVSVLGESATEVVSMMESERRAAQGAHDLASAPNPFAGRDKNDLVITAPADTSVSSRQLRHLQNIVSETAQGVRHGKQEFGADRAHEAVTTLLREAGDKINAVNNELGRLAESENDDETDGPERSTTDDLELLQAQSARLKEVAETLPSRRVYQLLVGAYDHEIGVAADKWRPSLPIPLLSLAAANRMRQKNAMLAMENREMARNLPEKHAVITNYGTDEHRLVAAYATLTEGRAVTNWASDLSVVRQALSQPAYQQHVINNGPQTETLLEADRFISEQVQSLITQAKQVPQGVLVTSEFGKFTKQLQTNTLAEALQKHEHNMQQARAALLRGGVTIANSVLKGGYRLGSSPDRKLQARSLVDNLRTLRDNTQPDESLFHQNEIGIMAAIDQGLFDNFLETVKRVNTAASDDEQLAFLAGQDPGALRAIREFKLDPTLTGLDQKLSTLENIRSVINSGVPQEQLNNIRLVLRRYFGPLAERDLRLSLEAKPVPEPVITEPAETTESEAPQNNEEAAELPEEEGLTGENDDGGDAEVDVEIVDDLIRIGDEIYPRLEFPEIGPHLQDLQPMEYINRTVLPDASLIGNPERPRDAIDQAVDDIINQAQLRSRQRRELAERRSNTRIPPELRVDRSRIDVLRLIEHVWDGPTRWTRGSLRDKQKYLVEGQLQADEYVVLVLGQHQPDGTVREHAVAETPIVGMSAMYITRHDTPGYESFHWPDVLTVPRAYARYFGARKAVHRERSNEELNVTMFKKAMTLLRCDPAKFRSVKINELENGEQ